MKNSNTKKTKKNKESQFLDIKNIDKSTESAIYYGFSPIDTPLIQKIDKDRVKVLKEGEPLVYIGANENIKHLAEEKAAILRNYFDNNLSSLPQPVLLTYKKFIDEESATTHKRKNNTHNKICLDIIGAQKSIAEAILIKTALAILEDNGFTDLYVEINSIGDRESQTKLNRELTAYFRKNINALSAHCRQAFKKDSFLPLTCTNEKCSVIKDEAPKAISCLSDESRTHFKEVLEYLESLDIPYKINDFLISDRRYATDTIFEIKQKSATGGRLDISLGVGFRTMDLCKKLGFKKDIPLVGLKLCFKPTNQKKQLPKIKKTSVFFIQLGDEAKHKSLKVIDILRKEHIYINHSLGRDKIAGQMAMAERAKTPYILIMGKKEAMDNTIMIRDAATRAQETVKIEDLANHLKKLCK